ncbi:PepSY domain-containing protein [Streptomyces sp. NPDC048650]|uniref:PepSY domain-containing protein n=1 Tax=unclassified Streptomyces TaxID=2593676 RepID=UPI0037120458
MTQGGGRAGCRAIGLVCAVAATGALLAGCSDGNGKQSGAARAVKGASASPKDEAPAAASPSASLNEDQAQRKDLFPKAKVNYDQALRAAVAAVPGTKAVGADLDDGNGNGPVWETRVATAGGTVSNVLVDAVSGKAGRPHTDSDDDQDDKSRLAAALKKATVTPQQAAQTAMAKTKGTVGAIELDDHDDGSLTWSVDVVSTSDWNKTTYGVDATNRKILWDHVDTD